MQMQQNSSLWHSWRKAGLGSSDAPVIMNASPWKTRLQLWREKVEGIDTQVTSPAMQRGIDLEPEARAYAQEELGVSLQPKCLVCPEKPYIRASLDGISMCGDVVVEIKCPGPKDHELALGGKIPEKYQWQLLHQMLVTGVDKIFYVSYDQSNNIIIPFFQDAARLAELEKEEDAFWEAVTSNTKPELSGRDVFEMETPDWVKAAEHYRLLDLKIAEMEEQKKTLRNQLLDLAGDLNRVRGGGLTLTRSTRPGRIDYSKIDILKGFDLEPYRGKSVEFAQIRCESAAQS